MLPHDCTFTCSHDVAAQWMWQTKSDVIAITNVSYDPTREFYEAYNKMFIQHYEAETGKKVEVIQSHGGSGMQARSVVEGCNADVVTLALAHDISLIEDTGLINEGWMDQFPDESAPYTSTIVFLVRKGNERNIKDWDDLIQPGVEVITPPEEQRRCMLELSGSIKLCKGKGL